MKFNGEGIQHIALLHRRHARDHRQARAGRRAADDGAERRTTRCSRSACPATARTSPRCRRAASCRRQHRRRQAAPAAADLLPDAARPGVLRVHPAQGRRRLRRRQLQGAVRVDRARPDAPRRARRRHERREHARSTNRASATSSPPRRSPARCRSAATRRSAAPYGLYAEQLSGTAFTAPRAENRRSWLYRIRPAAMHGPFARLDDGRIGSAFDDVADSPNQLRWSPLPMPAAPTDFVDGLVTMAGNGGAARADRRGGARLRRQPLDAAARVLQRRRRDADRPAAGPAALRHRARHRSRSSRRRSSSSRAACAFRVELPDGAGARLRLRELRRRLAPARPRPDRLQRPGQPARLPDAGRRLRRRRRRRTSWSRSSRAICGGARSAIRRSTSSPGTATTRRTSTTCAASTRSARSASTIPIRRSSPCCTARPTRRAWQPRLRRSSRRAGWWRRTRSARRGSIATSPASSWAWCTASTTPRPKASCPAARRCTTA